MITIYFPRIPNLGDFSNCLPTLSGLHKKLNQKFRFVISDGLNKFCGIKELLLFQDMFDEVLFVNEYHSLHEDLVIGLDDTGNEINSGVNPLSTTRYWNFIRNNFTINFEIDSEFELKIPKMDVDFSKDRIIVGDRWSPNDAPDVDARRASNMIKNSGIFKESNVLYLDYTMPLIYNCNLIKFNPNWFVTTFTGIGILADLMRKKQYIIWGDDLKDWNGNSIEHSFNTHYFSNRNSKLIYINDFDEEKLL